MNDKIGVGKSQPLMDGREKVTGEAKYTADVDFENMLHAKILGSPHPHARVKNMNLDEAKEMEEVIDILTYENVPDIPFEPDETRHFPILNEKVMYVGEPVAVVAAETERGAERALDAIEVEYEILPSVFDPLEALDPEAPKLYPEGNLSNPGGTPTIEEWGNVDDAFDKAEVIVSEKFKTAAQIHHPIEPRACVANWNGEELVAYVSTQFPHRVKDDLAKVLELPISKVRVKSEYVGGGFGGKKQEEYYLWASLLSKRTGRPVKLEYTRDEETVLGRRRYSTIQEIELAANRKGEFTGLRFKTYYNIGARGNFIGGCLGGFLLSYLFIYKFENARMESYDVNTNLNTAQPFRGVFAPGYHFSMEQLIDEVAERLDMDPFEIRLKNTYRTGEKVPPYGQRLSDYAIEECIDKACKASNFEDEWNGWDSSRDGTKRKGIGVATSMGWTGWMEQWTSSTVRVNPDSSAEVIVGTQDIGTGSNTTLAQIAGEILDIPTENIKTIAGDTKQTPDDYGCCGSRTLYSAGNTVEKAAKEVKRELVSLVARELGVDKEKIDLKGGKIILTEQNKKIEFSEILNEPISAASHGELSEEAAPNRSADYKGGAVAHVAEVEVDVKTGEVDVLNYVAVQDAGFAINPAVVENQLEGSTLQGLGYVLTEEMAFDEENETWMNPSFQDYKIFGIQDTPEIQTVTVESNDPSGPLGALGVGEHCINPVSGAIANAIYDALGVRINESPITPERILSAINDR